MYRRRVVERAREYMELLSQGVDPVSRREVGSVSVVSQPQLQKCFAFVSELLGDLLENGGCVELPSADGTRYELVRRKSAFSLTEQQRQRVYISPEPVTPNAFVRNLNRPIDAAVMEKLSVKSVNGWLLRNGFVTEDKAPAVINRTVWRPTSKAEEIGIEEVESVDPQTGEVKRQLVFTDAAQLYLLNRVEQMLEGAEA